MRRCEGKLAAAERAKRAAAEVLKRPPHRRLSQTSFAMDTMMAYPRLHGEQPVAGNDCILDAERALSSLSLTAKAHDAQAVHDLRQKSLTSCETRPRKPPRCPKPPPSGAQRKRMLSDELLTDGSTCTGHSGTDTFQHTPRASPAKLARSASLGRFTSVSNLAVFGGEPTTADAGPTKVVVRPHSASLIYHAIAITALGEALTAALDCSALLQAMRRSQSLGGGGLQAAGIAPWQKYMDWRRENPEASRAELRSFAERALGAGRGSRFAFFL